MPFGQPYGRAGLAGSAGRTSRHAAPPDRHPGRHRAGLGRAAAPSRQDRAVALRHAQPVPGQCRGRPPSVGDGLSAAEIFRPRRPRGGRRTAARRSGDADKPRMLGAFNEATPDWLSFFMFTFFTDRDGKMQLESLAQSGFDPLSRTCRFMLTEEAHHMFVGETGIGRTMQRTCEAMKAAGIEDPNEIEKVRALGVIDLPTIQKKLNLHYSLSLDLFGSEVSTNAANAFNAGIKGRFQETKIDDDHKLDERDLSGAQAGRRRDQARRRAGADRAQHAAARRLHRRLRSAASSAGTRSSRRPASTFKLELPHVAFHRQIGEFKNVKASPAGDLSTRPPGSARAGPMAAVEGRRRLHRRADEAGERARQVRQLDRAAAGRHRQQAGRFRIREDRGVAVMSSAAQRGRVPREARGWARGRDACASQPLPPPRKAVRLHRFAGRNDA